ncbi:MAG: hypothetical protein Q8P05_04270 [Candidatus Diapherotrites archaeon]|nr:hypothetical protein [Candidatus Diapherotrites archaeon]
MSNTTIQLSTETKRKISSFGSKGESYDMILQRLYSMAVKVQLREFLMASNNTISLKEARKEVEAQWPRSK